MTLDRRRNRGTGGRRQWRLKRRRDMDDISSWAEEQNKDKITRY